MVDISINIKDNCHRFTVGETVSGNIDFRLPETVPLKDIQIKFYCLAEVKWIEYPGTPYYLNGFVYNDKYNYLEMNYPLAEKEPSLKEIPKNQNVKIPFSFDIPNDRNLPSTMISSHGFIQYFVKVFVKLPKEDVRKFVKEIIVESPIDDNLMITVGFAPGESIAVHIWVENHTSAKLVPRISLHQTQIYMCGARHKTIETTLNNDPTVGTEINPNSDADEILHVHVPSDESLTIKSSVITVKYFVHVTLDIPHSFDLHINLPVVITSARVVEMIREQPGRKSISFSA
ncbi:hypothetical protein RDWZM_001851 [Blomia tropicalis]|uniref:Arrestin C-terminal-like domain-containing protein n=1 Tax=Blomia tropicalis TaxID=40697 RepID=A0A9Q0MCF3_BLOTA|nr:hypothetical protein RDWZM_001851 [Blomia tropicalis]